MLIQIYIKNEPLAQCDILVAKEDASIPVPAAELADLLSRAGSIRVALAGPAENMAMRAAIEVSGAIRDIRPENGTVYVKCPDKAILDGLCSMQYADANGNPVKCVPEGSKPAPPPRVRNKAKPPAPKGDSSKDAPGSGGKSGAGNEDGKDGTAPASDGKPADEDMGELMKDPAFVKDGEAVLGGTDPEPAPAPRDPVKENTPKIMGILKDAGIPSSQIPGTLEALREAMDPNITLPMQVKLKLAKDGAADGMVPDEIAKRVAPRFDELKSMLKEIDDANAAKS